MAEISAIEWTDATVNFWWGCRKVGPGCDHCYAETWAKRWGIPDYDASGVRRKIEGAIALIRKLQRGADKWEAKHGRRRRVFIQSMSDFFDNEVDPAWRAEAWAEIVAADRLDIQLVTKRIPQVRKMISGPWPQHVGLIVTVVNQDEAERDIPRLVETKGWFNIPWVGLSIEPMLGPIDLSALIYAPCPNSLDGLMMDPSTGVYECCSACDYTGVGDEVAIDWVIVGGESGKDARPIHPDWVRDILKVCAGAGVPFLFKQWGAWVPTGNTVELAGGSGQPYVAWPNGKIAHGEASSMGGPGMILREAGAKKTGRALDGLTYDGFPEIAYAR